MYTFRLIALLSLSLAVAASLAAQTPSVTTGPSNGGAVYATYAAKPEYPYLTRAHHVQGSGVFTVHIDAEGRVRGVDTLKSTGDSALDNAAITAFRKWRFRPPGRPTKVEMPIIFTMHGAMPVVPGPTHGGGPEQIPHSSGH